MAQAGVTNPQISDSQRAAGNRAAQVQGVPGELVIRSTVYKYGNGATAAQFNYVAGQLAGWYRHFATSGRTGGALTSWQAAVQQETGATGSTLAVLTSGISTALTGQLLAPALTPLGESLTGFLGPLDQTVGGIGAAVSTGLDGLPLDTTGVPSAQQVNAATGATGAGGGSGDSAGSSSGAASTAAKAAAPTIAKGGLAALLGVGGMEELAVRALEALAGAALLLLGLQALTGQGSGNPVSAVRSTARKVVRR